jgi:hypothetical protein
LSGRFASRLARRTKFLAYWTAFESDEQNMTG